MKRLSNDPLKSRIEKCEIKSERRANSAARRTDLQRAADRSKAKAHCETHSAPPAPPGAVRGDWGCGFGCAFASLWPAARCRSMHCFRSWFDVWRQLRATLHCSMAGSLGSCFGVRAHVQIPRKRVGTRCNGSGGREGTKNKKR